MPHKRLSELLAPYRTEAIATAVGVGMAAVRAWRKSEQLPRDPVTIQGLTKFLGMDSAELLDLLAWEETQRQKAIA
jgi:hypothetical protein